MASATTVPENSTHVQINGKIYRVLKVAARPANGSPVTIKGNVRSILHKENMQKSQSVITKTEGTTIKAEGHAEADTIIEKREGLQPRKRNMPDKLKDFVVNPEALLNEVKKISVKQEQIDDDYAEALGLGEESETENKCPICKKTFALKGNLKAHMKIHSDAKPFSCTHEGCNMSFRTKQILKQHAVTHSDVKPWTCWVCKKGFSSKVALKEHEAIHTDTKLYKCPHCDRKFRQNSCLSRHLLRHSDEKGKYMCHVCMKTFKMAIYLRMHMKVHTGERPHVCDVCSKSFAHKHDLNRHKIIHSGHKPYACSTCGQRFNDGSSRRRHEREHDAANKKHQCPYCQDVFKRESQLKAHCLRKHHVYSEQILEKAFGPNGKELLQVCMPMTLQQGGRVTMLQPFLQQQTNSSSNTQTLRSTSLTAVRPVHIVPAIPPEKTNTAKSDGEKNKQSVNSSGETRNTEKRERPVTETQESNRKINDVSNLVNKSADILNSYPQQKTKNTAQTHIEPATPVAQPKAGIIQRVTLPKLKGQTVALDTEALLDQVKDQIGEQTEAVQMSCSIIKDFEDSQMVEVRYHFVQPKDGAHTDPTSQKGPDTNTENETNAENITNGEIETTDENTTKVLDTISADSESVTPRLELIESIDDVELNLEEETNENADARNTSIGSHSQSIEEEKSHTRQEESFIKDDDPVQESNEEAVPSFDHDTSATLEHDTTIESETVEQESHSVETAEDSILNSEETKEYSTNPDFESQEFYNWLTAFSESCKQCTVPVSNVLYRTIAKVKAALVNIMSEPSGVLANRENFHILMGILKDLTHVIDKHLEYVLTTLSE